MTVCSRRLKNAQKKPGIMHNFDKCIIKTKWCSFGNQYTPEGVKSDMKEVAIKQMQPPINKQQLKFTSRYGEPLIYYMPNISYLLSNLRDLLKKDALFQWSEAHDVAFKKIKSHMSNNVCDRYLDTTKDLYCRLIVPK